jgi:ABC-2 type transport system ATP-binding protein
MTRTSAVTAARAPAVAAPLVSCRDLVRRFGERVAVGGVSFDIAPGETYGLLGPNGAGKTTIIRMVCGLLRPDAGTVTIAGRPFRRARDLVGYVPQEIALYPDLTARENLRFFGRLHKLSGRALARRVDEVLALIDLGERGDDRVEDYSGGMRRRLNIGVGLLHAPSLLVLDEPTVGVDPQSRHAIMRSVRQFGSQGMSVFYTTHYMEEAERLCDRIAIIDRGHLVAQGTRRELVTLVGEKTRVELTVAGDAGDLAARCRTLPGVASADLSGDRLHLLVDDSEPLLPRLIEAARQVGSAVRSVTVREPDLESVFLHLTGTALRE